MKQLTLLLGALLIAGSSFAFDGKGCCKGKKNGHCDKNKKECCKGKKAHCDKDKKDDKAENKPAEEKH